MKANEDVVAALQRTTGLMQAELERSVLTAQMLGMWLKTQEVKLFKKTRVRIFHQDAAIHLEYPHHVDWYDGHL